jgi:phosphoribosylformylglycinamidine synthase subunit PurQ / glutaminase
MKPKALILRTAGTNCDEETAFAFELAGASPQRVHLNRILENPSQLGEFQLLAIPGGFSYGDDIAAGRIFANQIVHHLRDALRKFIDVGKPVIGVCNGFQVLIKTDLLPGPLGGRQGQTCTLTNNDSGRFVDKWIWLKPRGGNCIWTEGLGEDEPFELPVAHGEGKFVPADDAVRRALWDERRVALTYDKGTNPNGSMDDVAGITDASGLVLGLMPHPERFVSNLQHPAWTRQVSPRAERQGPGLHLFTNAVRRVGQGVGSGI